MEKSNQVKPAKKGLWAIFVESMNKASSGCGPGCGCNMEIPIKQDQRKGATEKPKSGTEQA